MKTVLINISDIHYGSNKAEDEGLVLKAFIQDVKEQVAKMTYDDIYVLIGGDLVFAASKDSYTGFDNNIVRPLMEALSIDGSHFIIVPGNHDLNREYVEDAEDTYLPLVGKQLDLSAFNDLIRKDIQKPLLFAKFDSFLEYARTLGGEEDVLTCSCYSINDKWSVHTLNTAILSCGGYKGIDDAKHLGVDIRSLHENLAKDNHENKILLMHHPENFCMDWVKHELTKLYGNTFKVVLSGHTHDQNLMCHHHEKQNYIHCEAPQLYTQKDDLDLGYSILEIEEDSVNKIIYREWFEKRNRFRPGLSFTDEDDGIVVFEKTAGIVPSKNDETVIILRNAALREKMMAFIGQPYIWVERFLSDDRIDQIFKLEKSTLFTETDIINNNKSIRIVAPSQYGLSCYGIHFLITLWEIKHEFGVFVDANRMRTSKFENVVEQELINFHKTKTEVKWFVIDNWHPYRKDQQGISKYIMTEFPDANVILMSPYHEHNYDQHLSSSEVLPISHTLYLTPLKHEQERLIVDEYNKKKFIDDSDVVLNKLDGDIKDFNLHRTPYSCFTLLTVFKDSFDKNPVNRTSVLENVLRIIFDNTKLPNYETSNPDIHDCELCLGYFCTHVIEDGLFYFSKDTFYTSIRSFCEKLKTKIDIYQLFDILCFNKIIVEDNQQYSFRFTFWVYYFVASWMHYEPEYAVKMLSHQNYQRYPEVLEFYTGRDRKRLDAVKQVTSDIKEASSNILAKIGIAEEKNPFAFLRFKNNKQQNEKIIKEIDATVNASNLPQDIKDQIADVSFNPSAAFHQDISKVYSDFSVGYLVNIISIACKVLRNSDHLAAEVKMELLSEITRALKVFSNIIYLVSHLFAKQGYIDLPEYSLKLTDAFNKYDEDERRIRIIVSIPYNLMMMYKDDLFSRKLSPVYIEQFKLESDKAEKHLLAAFIVYKQPDEWESAIRNYLDSISKDSYYLGTITELMTNVYYMDELDTPDRGKMSNLLKSAIYKADNGQMPQSLKSISNLRLKKADEADMMVESTNNDEHVTNERPSQSDEIGTSK